MELVLNTLSSSASAIQVITTNNDHSFTLDESALKKILLDSRVKDSKIIVLSIAGAFRKGKSFLLNFFLRYLNARGWENWIGDPDTQLQGFEWKVGTERNTTGILMWSEPFEMELANRGKACVLLMDTQGAFDSQSTVKDCATVFALSTILSSVQVYNIMTNIQENDLQYLELFAEYGHLVLEKSDSKPFQDLYFLVRDWSCPYEYDYGRDGGEKFLKKRLEITGDQHEEMLKVRRRLYSCFGKIGCYLLPYPGKKAATCQNFDGRLSDIDDDFKLHVKEFVNDLLSPESLVVKKINGADITGKELFEYFKAYIKIFQGNELPEIKSLFEATAEANSYAAVSKAMDVYTRQMELICGSYKPFVKPHTLHQKHDRFRLESIQHFQSIRKMGDEEKRRGFQDQLERQIEESFKSYVNSNEVKTSCTKRFCCCFVK